MFLCAQHLCRFAPTTRQTRSPILRLQPQPYSLQQTQPGPADRHSPAPAQEREFPQGKPKHKAAAILPQLRVDPGQEPAERRARGPGRQPALGAFALFLYPQLYTSLFFFFCKVNTSS